MTKGPPKTKLALRLQEARLDQMFVVNLLHTSRSHVSEYYNGKRELPVRHLPALCRVFKCGPEDLMGYVDGE